MRRPARYEPEYRESAVAMMRETGKPVAPVAPVAPDLGINEGTLGPFASF